MVLKWGHTHFMVLLRGSLAAGDSVDDVFADCKVCFLIVYR